MKVRVLGCSGAIAQGCRTTSFLFDEALLLDAGTGVGDLPLPALQAIDHVLLTHAHLDHIAALPLMVDATIGLRQQPLNVYGLPQTLAALREHIFNDVIWPDFCQLPTPQAPFIRLHPVSLGQRFNLAGKTIEVLPAVHTVPAIGYAVQDDGAHAVFTGDTTSNPALWTRINQMPVGLLMIETAFSDEEQALAERSGHLCPALLVQELRRCQSATPWRIGITHPKPTQTQRIMVQIQAHAQAAGLRHEIYPLTTGQEFTL